jgi:hypothetical protein
MCTIYVAGGPRPRIIVLIRWLAVASGVAAGTFVAALVFVVGRWLVGGGPAVSLALIAGLIAGGWLAGRMAPINGRFHGALAGLGMAGVVVVVARLSGSGAPTGQVLLLALLAILIGGITGTWGHRRH